MLFRGMILAAAVLAAGAGLAQTETPKTDDVDLGLQLERETAKLEQLQQRLQLMETQATAGRLKRAQNAAPETTAGKSLEDVPALVSAENLRVERADSENGLFYTVSAASVPMIRILEAISKTSALPLEVHPDTPRDQLLGRLWLELNDVDLTELLRIVAGTQSLEVMTDENGIVIGPMTSLTDQPIERQLRQHAVEAYELALFRYPASAEAPLAYMGIARHYAANGLHAAAIQTAQTIVEKYPKAPACGAALLLMGRCQEALQQYDAARGAYYRYADGHPAAEDLPAVLLTVGETWTKERKWSQAMPVLEELARQFPQSDQAPVARMRLAECMMEQRQYEPALEQLRRLEKEYERFPKKDELNLVVAECQVKLERFGPARVRLKEVIEKSPNPALAERAYYALAETFLAEGKPVAAIEVYRGVMRNFPEGALIRFAPLRLCRAYLQMGLYSTVEKTLKDLPESAFALSDVRPLILELGRYYLLNGNHERVLSLMADPRWVRDPDTDPDVLLLQAQAFLETGVNDAALQKATAAAALAKDETLRTEALRIVGECQALKKQLLRAAMAYGGKTE